MLAMLLVLGSVVVSFNILKDVLSIEPSEAQGFFLASSVDVACLNL